MSNLIKNELIKIFKKKSLYITLLVILAFVILTNCIYKFFINNNENYQMSNNYIQHVQEEINKLNPNNPNDVSMYINYKSNLETYEIAQKYKSDDWQINIISTTISGYVSEKNTYIYGVEKDNKKAQEMQKKIEDTLQKLEQDDWRYFANLELQQVTKQLEDLEEKEKNTTEKQELEQLKNSIESAKVDKEVAKYRVDFDIKYGNDFRNIAISRYQSEAKGIIGIEKSPMDKTYEEKQEYQKSLESKEISKYIIENNQDINKKNDLRGILKSFMNEYGLFIIVMIMMIAGTIVSEEFNKGTIKLLLVKPYSRNQILFSKLITTFIMIIFSIVSVLVMELIVGSIIFGIESLSIPVLSYNFTTNTVQSMNIFAYLGIQLLAQLPILILLAMLAFAFSAIFTNSALAIAISLLGYMSTSIINQLVIMYKVDFMRFFVTLNWDFSEYLFGKLPLMEGLTATFSGIMCIIYFIAMLIPTFIIFKKKNIKNI